MASRKHTLRVGMPVLAAIIAGALASAGSGAGAAGAAAGPDDTGASAIDADGGAAFAMTNATADNRIVRYSRNADGALTQVGSTSTGGLGIGVDLDTQGALRLSADHRVLYGVNAGSDNVSVFRVDGANLTLAQTIPAGDQPVSLALHDDVLYVLNGSVASTGIRGFAVGEDGTLSDIPNSVQPLSSPIAVPGDIEFSPDGSLLLVTQKTTARTLRPQIALDAFRVDDDGVVGPAIRDRSEGIRPFALAFRGNRQVLVAESFDATAGLSAVSSYDVHRSGALDVRSASVPNRQTDTCWILITQNGRYAYTANFGSGTISSYRIARDGAVRLQQGNAAFLGDDSQPVDLAQTADRSSLYLLLRGTGAVAQFRIGTGGALTPLGVATGGLPVADGASGLAVY